MRAGGAVTDFLDRIAAVTPPVRAEQYAAAVSALRDATSWILTNGAGDPNGALAAATPYLRMFGIVVGGWVMARQAIAAERLGADDPYGAAKRATARFYLEELLPQAHGLVGAITAGEDILFALTPEQLDSRR
jgi:hypothetical protein